MKRILTDDDLPAHQVEVAGGTTCMGLPFVFFPYAGMDAWRNELFFRVSGNEKIYNPQTANGGTDHE